MNISQPNVQISGNTPANVTTSPAAGVSTNASASDHVHGVGVAPLVATLGSNVALTPQNTLVAVLTLAIPKAGKYFVTANFCLLDTAQATIMYGKIDDGTVTIASFLGETQGPNTQTNFSITGTYTAAGAATLTLRIADNLTATGSAQANQSGFTHDCQMTAIPTSV